MLLLFPLKNAPITRHTLHGISRAIDGALHKATATIGIARAVVKDAHGRNMVESWRVVVALQKIRKSTSSQSPVEGKD